MMKRYVLRNAVGHLRMTLAFSAFLVAQTLSPLTAAESPATAAASKMRFVNVREFGATGDGKTDDTEAIRAAIASLPSFTRRNPFSVKPIFFPNGTYIVSKTIERVQSDGKYAPALAFVGESKAGTILRLIDNAVGFGDEAHPRPVINFTSGLLGGPPTAGGKNYLDLGEGNDAYQNYLETLTIETGRNDPGAIGVDYLASNIGAIRNARIRSADGKGSVGISLTKKWIGPALLKNVSVEGFSTGIDIANTEYSITLDSIRISGSQAYGIRNTSNSVSINDLEILTTTGVGIANLATQGLLVGRDIRIDGNNKNLILNQGYMNLTRLRYVATQPSGTHLTEMQIKSDGVYGPSGRMTDVAWKLPVVPTPQAPDYSEDEWADVTQFGADPDPRKDSGPAIQRAMNSGRKVICLPNGIYRSSTPITIPSSVQRIEGSFSTVFLDFRGQLHTENDPEKDQSEAGFIVGKRDSPLFWRRIVIRNDINNATNTARIAFLHSGAGGLVLEDVAVGDMTAVKRLSLGGSVWAENIIGGRFFFEGKNGVWIRQLNTEGKGVHIRNEGAPLWVLGTKTEGNMTLLENSRGAMSELFGGLAYMVHPDGKNLPYIRNSDGQVTAAFAEEAFLPNATYETLLDSEKDGIRQTIKGTDMPERHHSAHIVPQISTESTRRSP